MLPAAVAGAYVTFLVLSYIQSVGSHLMEADSQDPISLVWSYIITSGALGWSFVHIGVFVAPRHRQWVALVLGAIGILVTGFALYQPVMMRDWWAVFGALAMACGCGFAGFTNYKEHEELDAKRSAKLLAEFSAEKPV